MFIVFFAALALLISERGHQSNTARHIASEVWFMHLLGCVFLSQPISIWVKHAYLLSYRDLVSLSATLVQEFRPKACHVGLVR